MYQKLTAAEYKKHLCLPEDYEVSGVLVMGHWNGKKYRPLLKERLKKIYGASALFEEPLVKYFCDVLAFTIQGKRFWFDCVYGQTYLSELIHIACLFGSQKNILIGSCGGLNPSGNAGDYIVPKRSFADESAARMYDRGNREFLYESDRLLSDRLAVRLNPKHKVFRGNIMTVQAMLGETKDDIDRWSAEGFDGVDMESGVIFAVSNYFKTPSAAILYISDNLIAGKHVLQDEHRQAEAAREGLKVEQFNVALKELVSV